MHIGSYCCDWYIINTTSHHIHNCKAVVIKHCNDTFSITPTPKFCTACNLAGGKGGVKTTEFCRRMASGNVTNTVSAVNDSPSAVTTSTAPLPLSAMFTATTYMYYYITNIINIINNVLITVMLSQRCGSGTLSGVKTCHGC